MYGVFELLRSKGAAVHTIEPDRTVLDAAREMNQRRIGSLVVVNEGRVVGIITERDILTRIVAAERAPASTRVADAMTSHVLTCGPSTSLDELRALMRQRRIRHVPVIEDDRLLGMVSIGDLNVAEAQGLSQTISYLEAYISG
jgi:CBS domain-containing protein